MTEKRDADITIQAKCSILEFRRLIMLTNPLRTPRPKLTGPIFGYAMVDVVGLSCVGIGASWFAEGKGAILTNFPTSTAEAVACTAGGIVIMLWSVSRILREIAKQAPEMQAKYDQYIGAHYPDKLQRPPEDDPK
jgi:hypothetical protein